MSVRVVSRHVHPRVAHDGLNDCRVRLFVHQETRETVPPTIVKAEAAQPISLLAEEFVRLLDQDSGAYRSGPKVIPDQYGRATRLLAA